MHSTEHEGLERPVAETRSHPKWDNVLTTGFNMAIRNRLSRNHWQPCVRL